MFHDDLSQDINRFAHGLIRRKVNQIIGQGGFSDQEREDLTQELLAKLIQGLRRFDPTRATLYAFITTLIERATATLWRNAKAKKRKSGWIDSQQRSLETDDSSTTLAETISHRERYTRLGTAPRSEEELAQLDIDLAETLSKLPRDLRQLAYQLMDTSVAQAARNAKVPRTSLYRSIELLRRHFEKAGLKEYL